MGPRLSPTPTSGGKNCSFVTLQFLPEVRDVVVEAGLWVKTPRLKLAHSVHDGWGGLRLGHLRFSVLVWDHRAETEQGEPGDERAVEAL